MGLGSVTPETRQRIELLFSDRDADLVEAYLEDECGNILPFLNELTALQLERLHFAALKLSNGNFQRLQAAVELAKLDWRDLLTAADFANDVHAHQDWLPDRTADI